MDPAIDERLASFTSDRGLQEVCESNGLTQASFAAKAPSITHLDLFMGLRLKDLSCARHFTGLRSMCVMKQLALDQIVGLEQCTEMEILRVTECQLATLAGLGGLPRLTTLHLRYIIGPSLSSNELFPAFFVMHEDTFNWAEDNTSTPLPSPPRCAVCFPFCLSLPPTYLPTVATS